MYKILSSRYRGLKKLNKYADYYNDNKNLFTDLLESGSLSCLPQTKLKSKY